MTSKAACVVVPCKVCRVCRCSTDNLTSCDRVKDPQDGLYHTEAAVGTCHTLLQQALLAGCLSAVINTGKKGSKGSFCWQELFLQLASYLPLSMSTSDSGRMKMCGRESLVLTSVFSGDILTFLTTLGLVDVTERKRAPRRNGGWITGQSVLFVYRILKGKQPSWWTVLTCQDCPDTFDEELLIS